MQKLFAVTIDETLIENFKIRAKEKSLNKSLFIANYLERWLKENPSSEDMEKVDE